MTTQTPREVVDDIIARSKDDHASKMIVGSEIRWAIEAAKAEGAAAERERWKAFAGPDGEPRKVLGKLPVTADGFIVGHDAKVFNEKGGECDCIGHGIAWGPVTFCVDTAERCRDASRLEECFSSREAALAAAGKAPPILP